MAEELSSVTIIIFIACGVMTIILIILFGKRQITRFSLKSRREPHYPICQDAPKSIRRETERRLQRIIDVKHEPKLLEESDETCVVDGVPYHNLRMKAVDTARVFEVRLCENYPSVTRRYGECLRSYLLNTLGTQNSKRIHQFCDLYEQARFDPKDFTEEDYKHFSDLLTELQSHLKTPQSHSKKSPGASPSRHYTSSKKSKLHHQKAIDSGSKTSLGQHHHSSTESQPSIKKRTDDSQSNDTVTVAFLPKTGENEDRKDEEEQRLTGQDEDKKFGTVV